MQNDAGRIALAALNPTEVAAYRKSVVKRFAEAMAQVENLGQREAEALAEEEVARLLRDGIAAGNHQVRKILKSDTDEPLGLVWYAFLHDHERQFLFIYDLYIEPEKRRQGIGSEVMAALAQEAKHQGAASIRLHVFGHNEHVRPFFEKAGYRVSSLYMWKDLMDS